MSFIGFLSGNNFFGSNRPFHKPKAAFSRLLALQGAPTQRRTWRRSAMDDAVAKPANGAVTGGVKILLRLEGLTLFAGMVLLYAVWGGPWWIFALLFLAPDLSFIAYLLDARTGAIVYNAAHSYMLPAALMTLGFALPAIFILPS
jgi:hypothetical protein